jgi:hypothetical protein
VISLLLCLAAAQDPVFRASTSLVRVDAEVVLPSGAVVSGLQAGDFRVLDQGLAQPIVNFGFEEDPLDLILLFDTSAGMKGKIQSILRAAELGFHELRAGDRVSVMGYGAGTRVAQGFTSELDVVNEAIVLKILAGQFAGRGWVETAAGEAAGRFRSEPVSHRKRAILAISDKGDAGSGGDVRLLWDGNIVFSELLLGKGGATRVVEGSAGSMAGRTGGVAIAAGVPGEAFQQSVHYLRSGYTLYYALPAGVSGSERSVRVELTPEALRRYPGARVRGRTGYLMP